MTTPPSDGESSTPALFGGRDAAETKRSAALSRAELTRQVRAVEAEQAALHSELERQRQELEADFAARRAEMAARLGPLKTQVAQLQEVMWSVDLYLGRDEQLQLVRDGVPAPSDTPITVRQKVLVMAEESLVCMGRKARGMDADDIDVFVRWLIDAPANLDRILPEQRGVVVLVPTRVKSRSGNVFEDIARDEANRQSWWLLRNGERLYLLTADMTVGDRLLPRRREFVEVFDRRLFGDRRADGRPLVPGSEEWLELEKTADARRRHYMRIMMVLQGIIDRTVVWQPLPIAGVNLFTIDAQDSGKVVLIQDDEDSIQLGDARESFAQWQRRLNGLMRPGLRIIGSWGSDFQDLAGEWDSRRWRHPRMSPANAEYPESGVPHLIEGRRDGGFVIRFARTDKVYKRNVPVPDEPGWVYRGEYGVPAQRRASCLVMANDTWVLPYDLASVAELRYHLNNRADRSAHFLSMVPIVRAALAAKESEAAAEAPFRGLLAAQLIDSGAEPEAIDELVDELVHWWKLAHTWTRPLNGDPAHEGKAVREILAEYRARRAAAADPATEAVVTAGRKVPGAVCVARNRQGRWHVYSASTPAHDPQVFCDITPIRRDGTLGAPRRWQTVPVRSATLLHVAWAADQWSTWLHAANLNHYLTAPERAAVLQDVLSRSDGIGLCITEFHDQSDPATRRLTSWCWTHPQPPEQAEIRAASSPLSWHYERGADQRITARTWSVTKAGDTVTLTEIDSARDDFGTYSIDPQDPQLPAFTGVGIPWWPDTAPPAVYEVRPRLAWYDGAALEQVDAWTIRCREAAREDDQIRQAEDTEVYRYVDATRSVIREERISAARSRFHEDYGYGADDLWPAHLKSLRLDTDPICRSDLRTLIATARSTGHPVIGATLAQLDDNLREHQSNQQDRRPWSRIDISGYEHIQVPDPAGCAGSM